MASLGELLTDQEINLMMGEAGAADGKVTLSSITLNTLVIFSSVRKYNFTDFPQITIADFKRLMAKWTS